MAWTSQSARPDVGWLVGKGGGETAYHYGYPTYGAAEPNVLAQWIFDEASGSIVDEVAGVTLLGKVHVD